MEHAWIRLWSGSRPSPAEGNSRVARNGEEPDLTQDEEYLNLLSIFHYIVAGLTALASLFPVIHLAIGIAIVAGAFGGDGEEVPVLIGWLFVAAAVFMIALGLGLATLMAFAGGAIRRRQDHTFCVVVAAVSCLMVPFGTVLGIFTIVILSRDSVKRWFGIFPAGTT
jgi:hypothetical protein